MTFSRCFRPLPSSLVAWVALLAIMTASSSALAAPPKKKAPKPKPADKTTETAPPKPPPAPEPEPEKTPPPSAAAESTESTEEATPAQGETPAAALSPNDITNTAEDPNRRYYFAGLRYRGTIIPQFIVNLFADEGGGTYSNTFGAEFDMRKGGQSMIPWIVYTEYGMGDTLFHEKGKDNFVGNYSAVNSSLKALYLGLDELWSVPIDQAHHWDFEFGFGVGVGFLFGDLVNNWVYQDVNGTLTSSAGAKYRKCQTEADGLGCARGNHNNAQVAKVGGYKEPFWFSGGSVPNIFPNVWFPTLGVRYKPIKQAVARVGVGFSLTGFWFGISGDYGLEKPEEKGTKAPEVKGPKPHANFAHWHDML
jgi:hypothetical protein